MKKVCSLRTLLLFLLAVTLVGGGMLSFTSRAAAQEIEHFFVEEGYDADSDDSVGAIELLVGTHGRFFIEEEYWSSLSAAKQAKLQSQLQVLLSLFDATIYPRVTAAYGEPWNPGIDDDAKITLLFTEMNNGVGGYFRFDDESSIARESRSNEREMLYMNVLYADQYVTREFMAHELVHLIQYNQKTRVTGVRENVWLGELLAELGPRLAGLNDTRYTGTNLEDRVQEFIKDPNNSLTEWDNTNADYSAVALFGHYLYSQYGIAPLREALRSPFKGVDALNDGLAKAGVGVTTSQAFANWAIANVVNDCAVEGGEYCYDDPQLSYGRVHIAFQESGQKVEDGATFAAPIEPWSVQWLRVDYDQESEAKDVLVYELAASVRNAVKVPYVVYEADGDVIVQEFTLTSGSAKFAIKSFGEDVNSVIFAPLNTTDTIATFRSELYTDDVVPVGAQVYAGLQLVDVSGSPLVDGDLMRVSGTDDVYIVKFVDDPADSSIEMSRYRRLILNPDIFNSYGHLDWGKIKTVSQDVLDAFVDSQFVMEVYADGTPVNGVVYQLSSSAGSDTGTKRVVSAGSYNSLSVYKINHLEAADTFYPTAP